MMVVGIAQRLSESGVKKMVVGIAQRRLSETGVEKTMVTIQTTKRGAIGVMKMVVVKRVMVKEVRLTTTILGAIGKAMDQQDLRL